MGLNLLPRRLLRSSRCFPKYMDARRFKQHNDYRVFNSHFLMRQEEYVKRYFYITIHFSPDSEGTVLVKREDGLYVSTETGDVYRKRLLYDFGWGQENGFELMPQLSFDNLIKLVEQPMLLPRKSLRKRYTKNEIKQSDIMRSNLYGAAAVIMQDHTEEFVEFLSSKVGTGYFSNPAIRENFKCFCFDSQKTWAEGRIPGGILTRSYEDVLNDFPRWRSISSKVINEVYSRHEN